MTATFGKLQTQTLTLEPGLNLLQMPNETGKSTWCAFLDRKSTRLNSSHTDSSRMPSSA